MKPFIQPPVVTPKGEQFLSVSFGDSADAERLDSWNDARSPTDMVNSRDSIEFASLAGKRWRYYAGRAENVGSIDELVLRSAKGHDELGFLLVAKLPGSNDIIGMAWCRHTWCNHLVLDFLASHPLYDKSSGYRRIGASMLLALGHITRCTKIPLIWGEATLASAGFYKAAALQENKRKVQDHFFIRGRNLANLQRDATPFVVTKQ
jgi:hypothetical protein